MKTQVDPTKEQQHQPLQLPQKAPSAAATLADHRPQTLYQRQLLTGIQQSPRVLQAKFIQEMMNHSPRTQKDAPLQAAMQAHVEAKAAPVQRMAAKGSLRFRQIAAEMGATYGVDTSGLRATHHSPFPARLNAAATIQGRNIHFAPGKDTDHNIQHEVAHAIDNTLNGTPKGDRVVNGQMVDTTREKVVESMINQDGGITQRKAPFLYPRPLSSSGVFQLKPLDTKIDPNKLNVVGERHDISGMRRDLEKQYTRAIFEKKDSYWLEYEINDLSDDGGLLFGDSIVLGILRSVGEITRLIEYLIKLLDEKPVPDISRLYTGIEEILIHIREIYFYFKFIEEMVLKRNKVLLSLLFKKPIELIMAYYKLYNTHLVKFGKYFEKQVKDKKLDEKSHRDSLRMEIKEKVETIYTWTEEGQAIEKFDTLAKFDIQSLTEQDPLDFLRSKHMQMFAERNAAKKGIWKVGDDHIYEILELEGADYRRKYNLMSLVAFDRILVDYHENPMAKRGLHCAPSCIFPWW